MRCQEDHLNLGALTISFLTKRCGDFSPNAANECGLYVTDKTVNITNK